MKITLIKYPTADDWWEVKRRALITIGKTPMIAPHLGWKRSILEARHSPIRYLWYCFLFEGIPSNTSNHLRTHHIGTNFSDEQFYISSLRNDRQENIDGDKAPRDTPVDMILDINAESLMIWANKRLCMQAAPRTRQAVQMMCRLVEETDPEVWEGLLIPMCQYHGGVCHEMKPCGRFSNEGHQEN